MGSSDKFQVHHTVFDAFTERNLHKLASQGFFTHLISPISLGKEANVFLGINQAKEYVAVKIYRLENCNFNTMWSYLATDPRYNGSKLQKRQIILAWVQREFRNLLKARQAGVRVPTPLHVNNNILVEQFIGNQTTPAPQLNKSNIQNASKVFETIIHYMSLLYTKAQLIHADLSAFNILINDHEPIFIDMSQSTNTQDPNAQEYLKRDIRNICSYFERLNVQTSQDTIYNQITNLT